MSGLGISLGEKKSEILWEFVSFCTALYNFALNCKLGMEKLQLLLCKNTSRKFLGLKPQQA